MIAGLVFSLGDMAHVYSGMAQYPHWQGVLLFNIPWWVPLEFAGAAFLLMLGNPLLLKIFRITDPKTVEPQVILASFLWTLQIYFATSVIPETSMFKTVTLFGALAAQIKFTSQITRNRMYSWGSLLEISSVAIAGCSFEWFLGKMEVFTYFPSPSIMGTIPVWLPCIYASVAITIRLFCVQFDKSS